MNGLTGSNIVCGSDSREGLEKFKAWDPQAGHELETEFVCATSNEIRRACEGAAAAFPIYSRVSRKDRAAFLHAVADAIEAIGEELTARCMSETALPEARLVNERGRTCNQIRLYADHIAEGTWLDARIDHSIPDRQPLPKPDMRRMLVPLGPVAVFGASNFPLAYSVAGGDTASALAAGCPVVVKAHQAHPGTSELVARAINQAVEKCGLPSGVFSLVHGGSQVGQALVDDPDMAAVGFTGSLRAGRALFDLAASRKSPIPVFAEMGSVNPVFILAGALREKAATIATGLASSVTLGVGQFCTNPGLLIGVDGEEFQSLVADLATKIGAAPEGTMLTRGIAESYRDTLISRLESGAAERVQGLGRTTEGCRAAPEVLKVSAGHFLAEPELSEELFGPCTLAVVCSTEEEMLDVANSLAGQLTGSIHAGAGDETMASELNQILTEKVGRIIWNGYPTGLEVCPSTNHGGPYPACTDSRFTSVGTAAVLRWARPVCWQDAPQEMLPPELQDGNPMGIWRTVDGVLGKV